MQLESLKYLSLNNNRLHGGIPPVDASRLVVLTLHRNELSGVLPESLQNLRRLAVLTLHENSFDGKVTPLKLTSPCIDNDKMNIRGLGCSVIGLMLSKAHKNDCHLMQIPTDRDGEEGQKGFTEEEMKLLERKGSGSLRRPGEI